MKSKNKVKIKLRDLFYVQRKGQVEIVCLPVFC